MGAYAEVPGFGVDQLFMGGDKIRALDLPVVGNSGYSVALPRAFHSYLYFAGAASRGCHCVLLGASMPSRLSGVR